MHAPMIVARERFFNLIRRTGSKKGEGHGKSTEVDGFFQLGGGCGSDSGQGHRDRRVGEGFFGWDRAAVDRGSRGDRVGGDVPEVRRGDRPDRQRRLAGVRARSAHWRASSRREGRPMVLPAGGRGTVDGRGGGKRGGGRGGGGGGGLPRGPGGAPAGGGGGGRVRDEPYSNGRQSVVPPKKG